MATEAFTVRINRRLNISKNGVRITCCRRSKQDLKDEYLRLSKKDLIKNEKGPSDDEESSEEEEEEEDFELYLNMQLFHKIFLVLSLSILFYMDLLSNWIPEGRQKQLAASNFGIPVTASSMLSGCETWHSTLNSTIYS